MESGQREIKGGDKTVSQVREKRMSTRNFCDCCDTVITRDDQLVVASVIPVVLEDPAWSGDNQNSVSNN